MPTNRTFLQRFLLSSAPFYAATAVLFTLCVVSVNYDVFKGNTIEWDRGGLNAYLATVDSLVNRGTFCIDDSVFVVTLDKMKVGEHYYSDKAPGFSLLLTALFFPFHLLGVSIEHHKFLSASLLTLFGVALPGLLTLPLYEKTTRLLLPGAPSTALRWSRNLLAFGTLWVSFSGLLNYHLLAGCLVTGGTYLLLRSQPQGRTADPRSAPRPLLLLLLAGATFGLLYTFDIPTGAIFLSTIGLYFLSRRYWKRFATWCLGSLGFLLAYHSYNYSITGKLLPPFLYRAEFYQYPGSIHSVFSLTGEPSSGAYLSLTHWVDVFRNLFGSVGLFSMSPILLLAVLGFGSRLRRYWREAGPEIWKDPRLFLGIAVLVQVLFYSCVVPSAIGSVYGPRHPLAVMPLFIIGFLIYLQDFPMQRWAKALVAASVVIALAGSFQDKQNTHYMVGWKQITPAYSFFHSLAQYRTYGEKIARPQLPPSALPSDV